AVLCCAVLCCAVLCCAVLCIKVTQINKKVEQYNIKSAVKIIEIFTALLYFKYYVLNDIQPNLQ
ncbi:hypothetical protein, partial [Haemophilus influenzae]|uniref:hypothetical protein n=1 Tax=Haemophilus influenzae TaxID=727 RepID=UPI001C6F1037